MDERSENIDEAWAAESESRIDAFETGTLTVCSFDDVIKNIDSQKS